jgi:hypothetical protein
MDMIDWLELIAYALCFIALVGLGVHKARRMRLNTTGREATTTSERLSDVRAGLGLGGEMFTVTIVNIFVTVAVLGVVATGIILALALVPKDQYVLVGILSLPVVIGALYVVCRSERWFFRKLRELKS